MDPCAICDFFVAHLAKIYFVYGLAFFVTGIVVWLEASRRSHLRLAEALPYLAAFGLIHGTHEWLEMFETIDSGPVETWARLFRLGVLVLSFVPLVEFGLRLAALTDRKRWSLARWILLGLFAAGAGVIWLRWGRADQAAWVAATDAWCRYSLAVPGSVLSAVGLYRYGAQMSDGRRAVPCNLQVVALAFLLYGLPGQVFVGSSPVPPSTVLNSTLFLEMFHFPVQLLRTVVAVFIVVFMSRGIQCFEQTRQERMEKLQNDRLEAQRRLTEEMAQRKELQRDLLHRTVQAQEEERRYIARELHDETAQTLTALSLGLGGVEEAVGREPDVARAQLRQLRDLVEEMMKKVNKLTTRLRPTMLDDLGLVPALITYADELQRHVPFYIDIEIAGERRRLPSELETTLYRAVQESLTNVARHADAENARVHLDLSPDDVVLTVADDGVGMTRDSIDRAMTGGEGWGLAGIRERATLLGGDAHVHSQPGEGTEIEVRIPIPEASGEEGSGS